MFKASSVYKICKWNQRAAFGNYSGSGWLGSAWLTCDYKAISVQLRLQLPTGTELGKNGFNVDCNKELWTFLGMNYEKFVVYLKMSTICSKIAIPSIHSKYEHMNIFNNLTSTK